MGARAGLLDEALVAELGRRAAPRRGVAVLDGADDQQRAVLAEQVPVVEQVVLGEDPGRDARVLVPKRLLPRRDQDGARRLEVAQVDGAHAPVGARLDHLRHLAPAGGQHGGVGEDVVRQPEGGGDGVGDRGGDLADLGARHVLGAEPVADVVVVAALHQERALEVLLIAEVALEMRHKRLTREVAVFGHEPRGKLHHQVHDAFLERTGEELG